MGAQEQQTVAQLAALAVSVLTGLISALALFICLRINASIATLEVKILRELQAYVRKEDCRALLGHRALRDCAEEAP